MYLLLDFKTRLLNSLAPAVCSEPSLLSVGQKILQINVTA